MIKSVCREFQLLLFVTVAIVVAGCGSPPTLILVGDSITSSYGSADLGACKVTNIARGGAGIEDAQLRVNAFSGSKPSAMLIAIGVNDAKRRPLPVNFYDDWRREYSIVINSAKQKSSHVYLATILPVEESVQPYGNYAHPEVIIHLNKIIREIAKDFGVSLIDTHFQFSQATKFTVDGVHLNTDGYALLARIWKMEIAECR